MVGIFQEQIDEIEDKISINGVVFEIHGLISALKSGLRPQSLKITTDTNHRIHLAANLNAKSWSNKRAEVIIGRHPLYSTLDTTIPIWTRLVVLYDKLLGRNGQCAT